VGIRQDRIRELPLACNLSLSKILSRHLLSSPKCFIFLNDAQVFPWFPVQEWISFFRPNASSSLAHFVDSQLLQGGGMLAVSKIFSFLSVTL